MTKAKDPDLFSVRSAGAIVGKHLKRGATVVLESMVYHGLTESVLVLILEEGSGLICGMDFLLGTLQRGSIEAIMLRLLKKITKIVSNMNDEVAEDIASLYGNLVTPVLLLAISEQLGRRR